MIADELPKLQPGESLNLDLSQILEEFAGGDPNKVEAAMASLDDLATRSGCMLRHVQMRDIYVVKAPTAEPDRA